MQKCYIIGFSDLEKGVIRDAIRSEYSAEVIFISTETDFSFDENEENCESIGVLEVNSKNDKINLRNLIRKVLPSRLICVLSENLDDKIIDTLIENGIIHYIGKPIRKAEFNRFIKMTIKVISKHKEVTDSTKDEVHFKRLFEDSPEPLWEEDYTELAEYLEALKANGIKDFRKYFEDNPYEVIKCIPMIKILDVNKAVLKLHNARSKEELLGNLENIFTESSLELFKEEIIALAEGKSEYEAEGEVKTLDGKKRIIRLSFIVYPKERGINRSLLTTTDITKRKKAEETVKRTNRALKAISACNSVVIRAKEEEALLSEICKIIVEIGGYRMAWVGYAKHDENKTVYPVAQYGFEEGYLRNINVRWDNSKLGQGPTGKAIRNRTHSISKNIKTDKDFSEWRIEAVKSGYRSSIAIPLIYFDEVLGAINIYSNEIDTFTPNEIHLLTELANDLAFGINTIRIREEHKKNEERLRISEKELKKAQEVSHVGNWKWYPKENRVELSDELFMIYGISQEKFDGDFQSILRKIIHPEDRRMVEYSMQKALMEIDLAPLEFRVVWEDGTVRTVLGEAGERIVDEDDEVRYLSGIVKDISIRKKIETDLEESKRRLATLISNLPGITYRCKNDPKWTMEFMSDGVYYLTGYSMEDFINNYKLSYNEIIYADDRDFVWNEVQHSLKRNQTFQLSYRIITASGDIKWVWEQGRGIWDSKENDFMIEGIILDITEQKLNEEKLKKSEELYSTIIANIPGGLISIIDSNYNIVFTGGMELKEKEKTDKQIIGTNISEIYHGKFEILLKEAVHKSFEGEVEEFDAEYEHDYYVFRTSPLRSRNSEIDRVIVLAINQTERKEAELALKESEEKFRRLFETSVEGIVVLDNNGAITLANPRMEIMTGYEINELLKMNFVGLLAPEEKNDHLRKMEKRKKGYAEIYERRFIDKKGESLWFIVSATPLFNDNGEYSGSFGMCTDITDRKRAQLQIELLSRAIEQSPVSVVITNSLGEIEYANSKFSSVTGYSIEEVKGKNPRILKSGYHTESFYEEMWNVILSGKNWFGEVRNKKKNGKLYWESQVISPIVNDHGDITHFIAVKEDVTQKKKMVEELILAKEKAEEMNKVKSYFFANMSHELRTPFISIMGYAEILSDALGDPLLKEYSDSIKDSAKHLVETLNNILNLSKLEIEEFGVKISEFNITELLEGVYNKYESKAMDKKLAMSKDIFKTRLLIKTDKKFILEILHNLLNNSLKYTREGGIGLYAAMKTIESGKILQLKVSDTGIGIPEDMKEHIWMEFRQGSEGLNREYEGTGLGLTITKKYVELLNGKIYFDSEIGKGTTFTVEIPISE